MPSYNYHREAVEAAWLNRFPRWVYGFEQWVEQPPLDEWTGPSIYDWFAEGLEPPPPVTQRFDRPRLFVSHRKTDEKLAMRIAWLAAQAGWDYWIDVLDPDLIALRNKENLPSLTPAQEILATAAIVEFAMLNCSHLIAVMTDETRGSMWVPYEYGRVKDPAPITLQVACWRHPDLDANLCPEYLALGKTHLCEHHIRDWLRWELKRWESATGVRLRADETKAAWTGSVPDPLPSKPEICPPDADAQAGVQTGTSVTPGIQLFPGYVMIGNVRLPIRGYGGEG